MKRTILILILCAFAAHTFAKKVKFSVDLSGYEISPNGVHITGDFQTIAGFPGGDWSADSTPMEQEEDTDIYSIVVDIPAFQKYEFRFVNGDQFYESEFVPVESRVGYDFNDNRWIFVDSIANDTTFMGAIVFGGNAPAGMNLVRFIVNMENEMEIAAEGVHVAGSFQDWNPATIRLYSFIDNIFEIIYFVNPGIFEYKFYNGNDVSVAEIVPESCAQNGNRFIEINEDLVLEPVCFSYCVDCNMIGTRSGNMSPVFTVYPNPVSDYVEIAFPASTAFTITLYDITGSEVLFESLTGRFNHRLDLSNFQKGFHFVTVRQSDAQSTIKLVKK